MAYIFFAYPKKKSFNPLYVDPSAVLLFKNSFTASLSAITKHGRIANLKMIHKISMLSSLLGCKNGTNINIVNIHGHFFCYCDKHTCKQMLYVHCSANVCSRSLVGLDRMLQSENNICIATLFFESKFKYNSYNCVAIIMSEVNLNIINSISCSNDWSANQRRENMSRKV